jgi:hypothetical protein
MSSSPAPVRVLAAAVPVSVRPGTTFDADATWNAIISGRLTLFMAVPTIYVRLITAWEAAPPERQRAMTAACARLRLMVSGSAALPVPVLEKWQAISGHVLLEHAREAHDLRFRPEHVLETCLQEAVRLAPGIEDAGDQGRGSGYLRLIGRTEHAFPQDLFDILLVTGARPEQAAREDPLSGQVLDRRPALGTDSGVEGLADEFREPQREIPHARRHASRRELGLEKAQPDGWREGVRERHADEEDPSIRGQEVPPVGGCFCRSTSALRATSPKALARA